jgi:hypothetical protein
MSITAKDISAAITSLEAAFAPLEQRLNDADSRLGDGDTGTMLARLIGVMASVGTETDMTVGAYLSQLARASARSTGSSFGTLIIAALMAMGRSAREMESLAPADVSGLVGVARAQMMERSGTGEGAKTVIDSLARIEAETAGAQTREDLARRIVSASEDALRAFRDLPCRVGRARIHEESSIGHDDPGMLAIALIARETLSAETAASTQGA